MTAVVEPQAAAVDPRKAEAFAELARRESAFCAIQPCCPYSWCDEDCQDKGHFGDAALHGSDQVEVATTPDQLHGLDGSVRVRAWRYDSLDEPMERGVELDLTDAKWLFAECANFSPEQARRLADVLIRCADMTQPEQEILAEQVRVGDQLLVDGEWLCAYGVLVDELSNSVQVNVTADRIDWSDIEDRDENPESFAIGATVQIRRTARTSGVAS